MKTFFCITKIILYACAALFLLIAVAVDISLIVLAIISLILGLWIKPDKMAETSSAEWERNKLASKQMLQDLTTQIAPSEKSKAKQRIAENKSAGVACCPKCGSTSLSANKKGFSAGKAAAGMFLSSSLAGAVAGGIGSNKVEITCLNCGHKFKPGKK
nr:hypothetical protein [uncultured Dysosmobacter sp.]